MRFTVMLEIEAADAAAASALHSELAGAAGDFYERERTAQAHLGAPVDARAFPFKLPVRVKDGCLLVAADASLILAASGHTAAQLAAIASAVNRGAA